MKETQLILEQMGFDRIGADGTWWRSEWFGIFRLLPDASPKTLAMFIYLRGREHEESGQESAVVKVHDYLNNYN